MLGTQPDEKYVLLKTKPGQTYSGYSRVSPDVRL